jgi:RNA polymerase sigma factor (sigma-70 family)
LALSWRRFRLSCEAGISGWKSLSGQQLNQQIDCSDKKVIHRLYEKMASPAAWKAFTIVRRHDVANEIVQEVFIKLWQSGGKFPHEKAVYAWIYKACHNAAIDHVRSATHRRENYVESYAEDIQDTGMDQQENLIARELIEKYLKEISAEEAEIFVYAVVDRMTQVEIADLTGKSRRTIQRILARIEETYKEVRKNNDN